MILNRNPSSTHSYSVSGSTIADRRDAYETNKKDDALEMFRTTTSLTIQADDDEGNSGPAPISGPEVGDLGDLTERSQLADPKSPLDIPEGLSYYIQAAQHNHRAFLTTNLCNADTAFVTALSSTWLIGRSRNCAIVVHDRSVSRCHACAPIAATLR